MTKIAFFLNLPNSQEKDLSEILTRSYRLGGSEYEMLIVSYLLEKRDNGIDSILLSNYDGKVPHQQYFNITNLEEACDYCVRNSISKIVIDIKQFDEDIIEKFSNTNFLVWAHNIGNERVLNSILVYSNIKKIICVSHSQTLSFYNHPAISKACFIYNIILFKDKEFYKKKINRDNQHNVVYMGCIQPCKGFHILAKAWPIILQIVPDAQLYVIGTSQLYGKNFKVGKYGIAEQDYEDEFMPFLTDSNGKILPSVHFEGLLGDEKYEIMGKCKVGVPNPTGITETFCLSGVEMELMGCSICTIKVPVYEETIMNKKYLFDDITQIADFVSRRLLDIPDDYEDLYHFATKKFSIEKSMLRWEQLINTNEVEIVDKYTKIKRSLLLFICKYRFLYVTRVCNFMRYRIKHHLLKVD